MRFSIERWVCLWAGTPSSPERNNVVALHVSQQRFEALKRQATRLMRAQPGLTRARALDEVANQEHHSNWSLLAKAVEASSESSSPRRFFRQHQIILMAHLLRTPSGPSTISQWQEAVVTAYPARRYEKFIWIPERWVFESPDPNDLQHRLATAKRAIAFMDATGLRPSRRQWPIERLFGRDLPDHMCIWQDDARRTLVTAEPYISDPGAISSVAAWCQQQDWQWQALPAGCGIWYPCVEKCPQGCNRHTQMLILAPTERGADIQAIKQAWGSPRCSFDAAMMGRILDE